MSEVEPPKYLKLPSFIKTKSQTHRMLSEILQIEEFLSQAQNRKSGSKLTLPKTTADLDKFAELNKRYVLNHNHRMELAKFLRDVYRFAPVIGLVLPISADNRLAEGIIEWFRSNVHAQTLVSINIQARLHGGALIRIKHKTYDASLMGRFDKTDKILHALLADSYTRPPQNPSTVRPHLTEAK